MHWYRYILCVFLLFQLSAGAQERGTVWSLQRCVQYAIDHNISIKQDSITARGARLTMQQSQLSQLPVVTTSGSYGRSFGRSINPTTNQFVDIDYNFVSASGNANALLFGWMQVRNTIARNKLNLEAALADLDQLKDDVSLNVASSFLVALLAKEQITISKNQVSVSQAQLDQTRAFAEAGRLPELNVAQLESQVATDSANLINSIASYKSALLDLKALLNLDLATPFDIEVPDVEVHDQLVVSAMIPEEIYDKAKTHFGSIKGSQLRVEAADKNLKAAKGGLYPQLSMGYQAGTNFSSNYQNYSYKQGTPQISGIAYDSLTNHALYVYSPTVVTTASDVPFGNQFKNNFRQSIFLNLNVPIFNGWQSQYAVRQAKLNLASQQWNEYNVALTLKQNVYKAHNNAINAIQKYQAARRADDAATRALDFARKRYDLGLTSTVDLLVTQNSQFNAASNLVIAKYDLIFKLKVIDYYLGKEIKL